MSGNNNRVKLDTPEAWAKAIERLAIQQDWKDGPTVVIVDPARSINLHHLVITDIKEVLTGPNKFPTGNIKIPTKIVNYEWMEETKVCAKKFPTVTPK